MRIAVIDLGTNSTRLLIAAVEGESIVELDRRSTITRLGENVDSSGRLAGEAIERVFATLEDYAGRIEAQGVGKPSVVATSAVRDAANGLEFAAAVGSRLGWQVDVISGEREAELTYSGATYGGPHEESTLVIDIGGGSTELIVGVGESARFVTTTHAGSVRQTERHLQSDPPAPAELDSLRAEIHEIVKEAVPGPIRSVVGSGIAVAGTATSLAAIDLELERYDPAVVEDHVLSLARCRELLEMLAALPLEQRKQITGLHPDRAATIVAGAAILIVAMEEFGLGEIKVSEHDLLYGVVREVAAAA